jgi:hypothetical protein
MKFERHGRWDLLAAISTGIALVMIDVYVGLINPAMPRRRLALVVSGMSMASFGVVSILSIGLPILGAGVLSLAAAGPHDRPTAG